VRVYVYPADLTGCGYYRMIWPATVLRDRGHDVRIVLPSQRNDPTLSLSAEVNVTTGQIEAVNIPQDADVMVFQRLTHRFLADAVPIIRKSGVAVVVEIDDDLSSLDPSNPAFEVMHPKHQRAGTSEHSWKNTERACAEATLVVCTSDALRQRYARHGRCAVLPNYVPASYLSIPHEDHKVFGWAGGLYSHRPDLVELGTAVTRLVDDGYAFTHIGDPRGVKPVLRLRDDQEITQPGNAPISEYPLRLADLGVGLAPLKDTLFNQAKSWLKPLEYASVGVVPVISPRAEYRAIARRGIGLLAANQRDFYRQTRRLLDDTVLRTDMSHQVREVASTLTYDTHAHKWWDAWTRAYEIERSL